MNIKAKFKTLAAIVAVVMAIFTAGAQNSTISPYSRFGYGLLSEQANAAQRGMGGVGYAMRSGRSINFMNPASYAAIDTLTFLFDMAADGSVPPFGLYVLPQGTFLQVKVALSVENMQVHNRVQQHRAAVALPACGSADLPTRFVDNR